MSKRQDKHSFEDNPFVEGFIDWMSSPEGELSDEVMNTVWTILQKADVDASKRKIIWEDGQSLSIDQSVKRIHADYPVFPIESIDTHLTGWLEMQFVPSNYSQEQLDEFDRLIEKWVDAHQRQLQTAQNRARTRHS